MDNPTATDMGTDAAKWAAEFMRVFDGLAVGGIVVDEGLMIAWFANAIMAGHDWGLAVAAADRGNMEGMLRSLLAWARSEAADNRTSDPVRGRAGAMIATHVEDALRILILPVP